MSLLRPDVAAVVWAFAHRCRIALPHHDATTEVTHFFAVLVETFCLDRDHTALGLGLRFNNFEHACFGMDGVAVKRWVLMLQRLDF